jgi:hypothetical protein
LYRALNNERDAPGTKALSFDAHILQPSEENATHVSAKQGKPNEHHVHGLRQREAKAEAEAKAQEGKSILCPREQKG